MGAVYEAVRADINRTVAIKVLHAQFANKPEFRVRFTNEARMANRVEHPGLLQIIDHGLLADGSAYLVMEFLKGETLGGRIKRYGGHLPEGETLRLAHLVADSLDAAHAKGVIHRDLKPDNVMVVPDRNVPGGERTKLLDFGIAKLADDTEAAHVQTQTGTVMGTPAYMSPEQCRGLKDLDARTDVYALGAMLYVMLCGRPPFTGTQMAVLAGHLMEQPPPLESLRPSVSPRLAWLALRMLAKDKTHRPAIGEVVAELKQMQESLNPAISAASTARSIGESATVPLSVEPSVPLATAFQATQLRISPMARMNRNHRRLVGALLTVGAIFLALLGFHIITPQFTISPRKQQSGTTIPQLVRWTIDSEPRGAVVIRSSDSRQLCQTPCNREQPTATDVIEAIIHLAGYSDVVIQLSGQANEQRYVILSKLNASATASPTPAVPASLKASPAVTKKGKNSQGLITSKGMVNAAPKPEL